MTLALQTTAPHTVTFIMMLISIGAMGYLMVRIEAAEVRVVAGLLTLFLTIVAIAVLLNGHAKAKCEEVGWPAGNWSYSDNKVTCLRITVTTVKTPLDQIVLPKEPTK